MLCKYWGSESATKKGFVNGKQLYKCRDCRHRFFENGKSAKMKTSESLIVTALNLYYDGLSLRKT
jgi:transposase-like protein